MNHILESYIIYWYCLTCLLTNIIFPSLFLSPLHSTYLYIIYYGASRIPWISDLSAFLVIQASVLARYPLAPYFIDYANILVLVSMYFISCSISFTVLYYAWPTLRGRCTLGYFYVTLPYHYLRLVSCMLLFNTCISPDHLVCYHLTTMHAIIWQDPLVMS